MKKYTSNYLNILEKVKIDCQDVEGLYDDLLENELPETLKGRLECHIDSCLSCQSFKSEYELIIRLAKDLRLPPLSSDSKSRIHKNLNLALGLSLPS